MRLAVLTALIMALAIPVASADWFNGRCNEVYAWKTKKDGAMQFRSRPCTVGSASFWAHISNGLQSDSPPL